MTGSFTVAGVLSSRVNDVQIDVSTTPPTEFKGPGEYTNKGWSGQVTVSSSQSVDLSSLFVSKGSPISYSSGDPYYIRVHFASDNLF